MAPRRPPAKRKAARYDIFDSELSDLASTLPKNKVGKSRRAPTRRSPRLQAMYSGSEDGHSKAGPSLISSEKSGNGFGDESELDLMGVMAKASQAMRQHKSGQNDSRKSAKFLAQFRELQKSENRELAEYIQKKTAEMENFTSAFAKVVNAKYSRLSALLESSSGPSVAVEAQPLFKQGQETLVLCQGILKQYEETNKLLQGEKYMLQIPSKDEDRGQVLHIIDTAAKFGEMAIDGAFRTYSSKCGGLGIPDPKNDIEKLSHSFLKKSLALLGNKPWGEGVWGIFEAWHGISKVVRVNMGISKSASADK